MRPDLRRNLRADDEIRTRLTWPFRLRELHVLSVTRGLWWKSVDPDSAKKGNRYPFFGLEWRAMDRTARRRSLSLTSRRTVAGA